MLLVENPFCQKQSVAHARFYKLELSVALQAMFFNSNLAVCATRKVLL